MKLYIVIPVFNRIQHTIICLESLKKQSRDDFNIILVNDGSTDATAKTVAQQFPDVHLVDGDGNWWWTRSVNEGIKAALAMGADHILLMNNDVWLPENYIDEMIQATKEKPRSLIGSINITMERPHRIFFSGVRSINRITFKEYRYHKLFTPWQQEMKGFFASEALNGRGTLIPIGVFDKIGLFDQEKMPQYGADFDFAMRARKAGFSTFVNYNSIVYSFTDATGAGKPFIKQPCIHFLRSYINPYSQTSGKMWAVFVWRHGIKFLFPFSWSLVLAKMMIAYLKNNLKSQ